MFKLDDFMVESVVQKPFEDAFNFLDLSGRKLFYNQGYHGQGVIVAVVDTGVNLNHPELQGKVLQGRNFCSYNKETWTGDDHGHGTHVAGTIAGEKCGIAPKAKILPVKVLDGGGYGSDKAVIDACKWLKDWKDEKGNRVDIVSMSLSTTKSEIGSLLEEFRQAIKALVDSGIAVIVSSGNTGDQSIRYPSYFEEPITVGAVDVQKNLAYFSTRGKQVDVCQVGVNVLSAWYQGRYAYMSGTSMSTPIVSGIAALLISKYKALFGKPMPEPVIYESLKLNTTDLGIPGTDIEYGAGFCTLNQRLMTEIKFKQGSQEIWVNGQKVISDAPVSVLNDRTMVPLRIFGENLQGTVSWNNETKTATLLI